jgi:DnaJ-domain-containing protein 1
MPACASCGAEGTTPLGCEACGVLFKLDVEPTPFEVFGREVAFALDQKAHKKRLLQLTRLCHPDHHGGSAATRAESHTSLLNHAYEKLADEFLRADLLIALSGGPAEAADRSMPPEFLLEVLEWNEHFDEVEATPAGSSEREALALMAGDLKQRRAAVIGSVGAGLTPLPPHGDPILSSLRRELNAARYLTRALWRIRELRVAEADA